MRFDTFTAEQKNCDRSRAALARRRGKLLHLANTTISRQ